MIFLMMMYMIYLRAHDYPKKIFKTIFCSIPINTLDTLYIRKTLSSFWSCAGDPDKRLPFMAMKDNNVS